ncbi:hypothetical protein F4809DRAFT_310515 [Biscogniauxia mediterranea]|nr:hypothetical protein F4809DRAFT_310515 [Biscogniauxia mediterranea]
MAQQFVPPNLPGGQRPPPPPGAGGQPPAPPRNPLPVDMRGGPPVQISDVRQDCLSEAEMAAQLTEYFTYRFEKLTESGEYDDNGQPRRPTWDRAIRSQVRHMSQEEMARRIRYLDQHSQPLTAKKNTLSPVLQRQIDKAQQELMNNDPDSMNYQWVLAQVEHQLKEWPVYTETKLPHCSTPRKHCPTKKRSKPSAHRSCKKKFYERISLTTYFKRIPRPGAPIQALWINKYRRPQMPQNMQPPPPPPVRPHPQPQQQQPPPQSGKPGGNYPGPPGGNRPPGQAPTAPGGHPGGPGGPGGHGGKAGHGGARDKQKHPVHVVPVDSDQESVHSPVFSSAESGATSATCYSEPRRHHGPARPPVQQIKVESRGRRPHRHHHHHHRHHLLHSERLSPIPLPPPPPLSDIELEQAYRAGRRDERLRPRIVQAHPPVRPRPRSRSRSRPPPPPGFTRAHRILIDPADLRHPRDMVDDEDDHVTRFTRLSLGDSEDYDFEYRGYRHGHGHGHEYRNGHGHGHGHGRGRERERGHRHGHVDQKHGSSIMSEDPFAGSPVSSTSSSSLSSSPRR